MVIQNQINNMKIKFWGIRGQMASSPSPYGWISEFRKLFFQFFTQGYSQLREVDIFLGQQKITHAGGYGSSTLCVEVLSPKAQIIIDAGSGIKNLGDSLLSGVCGKGQGQVHIFITHFHWDHLIGLPFFTPIFIPGNEIHFYAVQDDLEKNIKTVFKKPFFPVDFSELQSKIFFHKVQPREAFYIEDFSLTPYLLDHTDPCWGLRVECNGKSYAHCSDNENSRISADDLKVDLPLYQNADVLFYDAQFSLKESSLNKKTGHSASQIGLDIAMREGVKKIIFGHHDIDSSTADIQRLEKETQEYYIWKLENEYKNQSRITPVQWVFAYEDQIIEL